MDDKNLQAAPPSAEAATEQALAPKETLWSELPGAKPPQPFVRTKWDRLFAAVFYVLGYWYVRILGEDAWHLAVFTGLYAAAVLAYLLVKGVRPQSFSWFWLAVLLSLGGSFALWKNESLLLLDELALHGVALYWPLCAAGVTLRGGTSSLLPMDACNAALLTPFGNWFAQLRCLLGGWHVRNTGARKRALAVLLGAGILLALLLLVVPLLLRADEAFAGLLAAWRSLFRTDWSFDPWPFLLALPVGGYLFGLGYGAANRRHTNHIRPEKLAELGGDVRVLPNLTVSIALGGVCAVYALFIGVQARGLFSAFAGRLSGTEIYSEFAREGFFDLCRVAAINGAILLGANLLSVSERLKNRLLRMFNVAMAALTLLILASAVRKMLLYIEVYGLTAKRVLTMAFMAMLAVLFGGIIVWQWKRFNLIRLAVVFAAVLFCAMALCNLDGLIAAFNAARGIAA